MFKEYFKDEATAIIFILVELDQKQQCEFLDITMANFTNKKIAKEWYENIKGKIENYEHTKKDIAMLVLEKLYKEMI